MSLKRQKMLNWFKLCVQCSIFIAIASGRAMFVVGTTTIYGGAHRICRQVSHVHNKFKARAIIIKFFFLLFFVFFSCIKYPQGVNKLNFFLFHFKYIDVSFNISLLMFCWRPYWNVFVFISKFTIIWFHLLRTSDLIEPLHTNCAS